MGLNNVDHGSNITTLNYPSVDCHCEFKICVASTTQSLGAAQAVQVNVVTKSGGSATTATLTNSSGMTS